jgi:hypothetical protein
MTPASATIGPPADLDVDVVVDDTAAAGDVLVPLAKLLIALARRRLAGRARAEADGAAADEADGAAADGEQEHKEQKS